MIKVSLVNDSVGKVPAVIVAKAQEGREDKNPIEEEHDAGNLEYMRGTVYQKVGRSK